MVIGNIVGIVMMVVAGALSSFLMHALGTTRETWILLAGCPVMLVLDVAYRRYRQTTPFGRAGGRLFFLPVWLISLVLLTFGIIELVR